MRVCILLVPALLAGCTSTGNPLVRSDLFETQARAAAALNGDAAAFDRLAVLGERWSDRADRGFVYRLAAWDRGNRDRAAIVADEVQRMVQARDAVVSQRELADVMVNALRDLESEYDSIIETLTDSDAPLTDIQLAAGQKYLARRMVGSLVLMSHSDMSQAVEAADLFGRDVNRFQQVLEAQLNGSEELGIDPPDDPSVEDSLAQIEELFSGYVADSAGDVLENAVARYDAWLAMGDLAALTPVARAASPAPAVAGPEEEAADEEALDPDAEALPAGDGPEDDSGEPPDDAFPDDPAAEDDMPVDEPPQDDGDAAGI